MFPLGPFPRFQTVTVPPLLSSPLSLPPQDTLNARVLELTAEVEAATGASSLLQASLEKEKEAGALLQASLDKEKEEAARRVQVLEGRAEAAEEATLTARREAEEQLKAAGEAGTAAEEATEVLRREKVHRWCCAEPPALLSPRLWGCGTIVGARTSVGVGNGGERSTCFGVSCLSCVLPLCCVAQFWVSCRREAASVCLVQARNNY